MKRRWQLPVLIGLASLELGALPALSAPSCAAVGWAASLIDRQATDTAGRSNRPLSPHARGLLEDLRNNISPDDARVLLPFIDRATIGFPTPSDPMFSAARLDQLRGLLARTPCTPVPNAPVTGTDPGSKSRITARIETGAIRIRPTTPNGATAIASSINLAALAKFLAAFVLPGLLIWAALRRSTKLQRRARRHPCAIPCTLRLKSLEVAGEILDISQYGCKIVAARPVGPDITLDIGFQGMSRRATVVWTNCGTVGIVFATFIPHTTLMSLLNQARASPPPGGKPAQKPHPA